MKKGFGGMSIPNLLTVCRILLTPLLVWLLLEKKLKAALVVFFIAGLTDGLDGLIARVFSQKTRLGAYLDPLADKLLLVSTFILLGIQDLIPHWLAVIAVSRDILIILGVSTLMIHHVPLEIRPSVLSKATTLFQLLTLFAVMGSWLFPLPSPAYSVLFVVTALLSVLSGIHYVHLGISLFETHRNRTDAP